MTSETFLFVFGLSVTLVVVAAVGGIWWAAVEDGRTNDAIRRGEPTGLDETVGERAPVETAAAHDAELRRPRAAADGVAPGRRAAARRRP